MACNLQACDHSHVHGSVRGIGRSVVQGLIQPDVCIVSASGISFRPNAAKDLVKIVYFVPVVAKSKIIQRSAAIAGVKDGQSEISATIVAKGTHQKAIAFLLDVVAVFMALKILQLVSQIVAAL